ncbi:hypothetical protein [Klebsiella pneumoniae]
MMVVILTPAKMASFDENASGFHALLQVWHQQEPVGGTAADLIK